MWNFKSRREATFMETGGEHKGMCVMAKRNTCLWNERIMGIKDIPAHSLLIRTLPASTERLWLPACGGRSGLSNDFIVPQEMILGFDNGSDNSMGYNGLVVAVMILEI